METSITSQDVIGRDPIGRFLFRLKLKPWQAGLLSFSVFVIYMFVLPAIQGTLFARESLERSSTVDRINMVGFFIIHPVVIFFYIWQAGAMAGLYHVVMPLVPVEKQSGVLRASRILHATSRNWLLGVFVGGGVMYLGFIYISDYISIRWYSFNWLMAIILQLSRFFLFYLIINILSRHLMMAFNLNRVYQHVRLPVLIGQSKYGDSFDAITRYGLWFAGFGSVLGMFIAMRFFWSKPIFPEDAIYLILYLLLVPLAFSLPFWQAHASMRASKAEALRQISDSLQNEYDHMMKNLALDYAAKDANRISTLRSLLEMTERTPTWPFENSDFYRVLVATVFPFAMTGIGVLFEMLI
ncbi:MAG: hypothetical protein HYU84_15090 [Chloroflexi bacterium]|nr:hypothetical protein [Chloroflexota bacterium]MBI3167123.1 hypothetical protein [Chloroflexota bacterium]